MAQTVATSKEDEETNVGSLEREACLVGEESSNNLRSGACFDPAERLPQTEEDPCRNDPARLFFVHLLKCAERWMATEKILQIVEQQCIPQVVSARLEFISPTGWGIYRFAQGNVFVTAELLEERLSQQKRLRLTIIPSLSEKADFIAMAATLDPNEEEDDEDWQVADSRRRPGFYGGKRGGKGKGKKGATFK